MRFTYKAFDKSGRAVAAAVDAPGKAEAVELLRRDGLFVTEMAQASEAASADAAAARDPAKGWAGRMRAGQRLKNLAMFARQLQVLVSSGTPLVQSLSALERQAGSPAWRTVVARLREQVEEGVPMSQAMAQQPQIFDAVCRSLTAAGETSGNMGDMLGRLATLLRRQLHLRTAVVGALIYPCVLVVIGVAVVVLMLLFVLPRFVELFTSLDVPLPPTTKILVSMSQGLEHYWWAVLLACAGAGAGWRVWWLSGSGRKTVQRVVLQAPKLGTLVKGLITARVARLLGVLVESQVPLMDALKLTKAAAVNYRYVELVARAEEAVSRGEPVSTALADPDLIAPSVYEAVRSGEQSGKVGSLLLTMADFLDEENEASVKSLTSLLEPLILVFLGVLVAFIALSMFLPLFDLAAIAQGGQMIERFKIPPRLVAKLKSALDRTTYSPIGLDLGTRCVKAVQLVRLGRGPWRIAAATVVENRADEPVACAASLKRLWEVLERQGFVGRRVVAAAPAERLEADVLELPPRSAGVPVGQIARSELARLSRLDEGAFEMASWDLPAPARASAGTATHLMAVALRHADAERLLDSLAAEGAEAAALDVQAWALARAVASQPRSEPEGLTAVLDVGHAAALLVLLHEGSVVYQRRLADGGTGALRRALCGRFNVGERVADLLLEGADGGDSTPVDPELAVGLRALVAKYLEGIVPDVEASFGYASHRYAADVQKLLVVGAGAKLPDVVGFLGRRLGMSCQAVSPAGLMACCPGMEGKCGNPLLTAALGLALHAGTDKTGAAGPSGGVDLTPAHRAARARRGKRRRVWAAACAGYTLALAGACGVTDLAAGHDLPALRAELERVKGEAADWTERHAQAREALAQASSKLRAARAVTDHPHWHLLLRALAPALGEDVVLRGVRIETSDAAQNGPPVALASAAARPARTYTVELRGYARSQPAVTQLPLKLEAMKLFDEVKLVRAQREPFLSADAVAFQVRCTLSEEAAP